jgi:hypothetical protein
MGMPFLIVAAVCGTSNYMASLRTAPKRIVVLASALVLAAFVASSVTSFRRYLFTGDRVPGIRDIHDAPNWTLDMVIMVSKAIDQFATPNEQVVSFWPGYIFSSKARPYPGFENDFAWVITDKLTSDERAKYHITARSAIEADFAAHASRIAVVGNQHNAADAAWYAAESVLRSNGYTIVRTIGGTSIFSCCPNK